VSSNPRCVATVGQLLLVPTLALAEPATATEASLGLRWSDPSLLAPTTEREFDSQLAARLGRPAFVASADEPTLSVTWQGTPERCRVELSLVRAGGVEGTRVIESPSGDCPSLVPALLTVSALLVESYESAQTSEAAPPDPAPVAPTPPPPPPASTEPSQPAEAPVLLSIGGALSAGFVPKLEIGPAAAATWAPVRHVRLGVAGSLFIGHDYGDGPGVSLTHQRAALLVCGMPLSRNLGLGLCGNLGLHHFSSSGTSLPRPEANSLTTWSVGAELRAEWRLTRRLWWVGHAGADVTTRPLYFYYFTAGGEPKNIFEQKRVNPVLLVALSLELP
jgi:hypothetical protein